MSQTAPARKVHVIPASAASATALLAKPPSAMYQGYGSVTGEGRSTAVTGAAGQGGAKSEVYYSVCTSVEKLAEALEINQSLSVGFGPFGVSEKVKFIHKLNVTTYGVSIVVYARHVKDSKTLTEVALKDGFKPPQTDDEIRDFVRVYGDAYVSSIATGGEFYAVYTFHSQTREDSAHWKPN